MAEKIYVKGSKAVERDGQYGPFISLSFKTAELLAFAQEHGASGYLNLTISRRKDTGKFGETHNVSLDTWKPKPRTGAQPDNDDDVPR